MVTITAEHKRCAAEIKMMQDKLQVIRERSSADANLSTWFIGLPNIVFLYIFIRSYSLIYSSCMNVLPSTVTKVAQDQAISPRKTEIQTRRMLSGHFGKIYSIAWAQNSICLCSAAQDGKLILWNCQDNIKLHSISLRSSWVMSCGYSPDGRLVSSGGLDNIVTIHSLPENVVNNQRADPKLDTTPRIKAELNTHDGYISSCAFYGNDKIITSSGDSTCTLFDIETLHAQSTYVGHLQDVMSASFHGSTLITGSIDTTVRLWDLRADGKSQKAAMIFKAHESDVNVVQFLRNGTSFMSGSDDSTCRLFDIRVGRQLNYYHNQKLLTSVHCLDVSSSGRYLFTAYETPDICVWDTLHATQVQHLESIHESQLSSLRVSPDGKCLASASWDHRIKIYA